MSRYPFESEFLYGLHDDGGERIMQACHCPGWVLISEKIGANPTDQSGSDLNYAALTEAGHGVIVRLNHGYYNEGTLPFRAQYADFAQRCANFVGRLPNIHLWIIGNETNMASERPGVQIDTSRSIAIPRGLAPSPHELRNLLSIFAPNPRGESVIITAGETITPEMYTNCYRQCRAAIHNLPGHENDLVLIGAVAPWNDNTGDWIQYFQNILTQLGPEQCDGLTIHTYTHGINPDLVNDPATMNPPYANYHFNFRSYQDFMQAIPANMRHLPVYITETDQDERWQDDPTEWLQRAYNEINWWNQQVGNQQIRSLILYRWRDYDQWGMQERPSIHAAFQLAIQAGYRWNPDPTPQPLAPSPRPPAMPANSNFNLNQQVYAVTEVNVRKSPGYRNKPSDDILGQIALGNAVTITGPAVTSDELTWWSVKAPLTNGQMVDGWAAEALPDTLLLSADAPPTPRSGTAGSANSNQRPAYTGKGPMGSITRASVQLINH